MSTTDHPAGYAGLHEVFVVPFYLSMMRLNALRADDALLDRIARAATVVSTTDVAYLLKATWREQVMGAWYSLAHPGDPTLREAVLDALSNRCGGDLTSPSLATAAVVLAGADAAPALTTHLRQSLGTDLGQLDRGISVVAIEFALGRSSRSLPRPRATEVKAFSGLLHIAARFVGPVSNWPVLHPVEAGTQAAEGA